MRVTAFTILCLLAPQLGYAEIYKWVDANGDVHYSDRRPPRAAETVDVETAPPSGPAAANSRNLQIEEALRIVTDSRVQREELDQERDQASADRQRRELECQQLADYRKTISAGGFLYRKDDEQRNALSDEEIAAELAKLDETFNENCTAHR